MVGQAANRLVRETYPPAHSVCIDEVGILIAGITLSALLFVAFGVLLAVALIAAAAYVGVALARRSSES